MFLILGICSYVVNPFLLMGIHLYSWVLSIYQGIAICLPQQLPGPAHPACSGLTPQQPAAGAAVLASLTPEREDGTDSIFFRSLLPQSGQAGFALVPETRTSACFPQLLHENSKIGIE